MALCRSLARRSLAAALSLALAVSSFPAEAAGLAVQALAPQFLRLPALLTQSPGQGVAALRREALTSPAAYSFLKLIEDPELRRNRRAELAAAFGEPAVQMLDSYAESAAGAAVSAPGGLDRMVTQLPPADMAPAAAAARLDLVFENASGANDSPFRSMPSIERVTIPAHGNAILSAGFSADGKRIITASNDGVAKVWDADGGYEISRFSWHKDSVVSAVISPDGRLAATGSDDGVVELWETETGKPVRTLLGHKQAVRGLAFSPDGKSLATASFDHSAGIWDVSTGERLKTFKGSAEFRSAKFSSDGARLLTANTEDGVVLWDIAKGIEERRLSTNVLMNRPTAYHATFSPDGTLVAAVYKYGILSVWDAATGAERWGLRNTQQGDWNYNVDFSPDGRSLATSNSHGHVETWDAATGRAKVPFYAEKDDTVFSTAFSPADGTRLLASTGNGRVLVWKLGLNEADVSRLTRAVETQPEAASTPSANARDRFKVRWDFLGPFLAGALAILAPATAAAADGAAVSAGLSAWWLMIPPALLLPGMIGKFIRFLRSQGRAATVLSSAPAPAQPPSGRSVLTGLRSTVVHHGSQLQVLEMSPDGRFIATAGMDDKVALWDRAAGIRLWERRLSHRLYSLRFSPDGSRLIAQILFGRVELWDAPTGERVRVLNRFLPLGSFKRLFDDHSEDPSDYLHQAEFVDSGSKVLVAGHHGAALRDSRTGKLLRAFSIKGVERNSVRAAASRDGRLIATAQSDRTLLWDAGTGALLQELPGLGDAVSEVEFDPAGERLLVSGDFSAHLFEVATGRRLVEANDLMRSVPAARLDRAGALVVAASAPGALKVWDAKDGKLLGKVVGQGQMLIDRTAQSDRAFELFTEDQGDVHIWDLVNLLRKRVLRGIVPEDGWSSPSLDGSKVLVTGRRGGGAVYDAVTGQRLLRVPEGGSQGYWDLKLTPEGAHLTAKRGHEGMVEIWPLDLEPGQGARVAEAVDAVVETAPAGPASTERFKVRWEAGF